MGFMLNILKLTKGAIPEGLIRSVLNKKLAGIGEVLEFQIDPQAGTGHFKVMLAGEQLPCTVSIDDYQFRREGKQAWITVNSLTADREWLCNLLERFVLGKTFEIPADKVELAEGFLG